MNAHRDGLGVELELLHKQTMRLGDGRFKARNANLPAARVFLMAFATSDRTVAYFDTNVFDNLVKKSNGVTDADQEHLRANVSSGRITVVVGHTNIRETLSALDSRPGVAREQLNLIAKLADWDRFVRLHSLILEDDIRHYAFNGERANTPFEKDASHIFSRIRLVAEGRIGIEELEAVIAEDYEQKRAFLDGVERSNAEIAADLEKLRRANGIPNFSDFLADGMEAQVPAFVESFDVAEDCKRGLDKLSNIPSIRSLVSLGMSFMYRTAVEKKSTKGSMSRDIHHAVSAAASADVFVTHDRELSYLLNRIPKGIRAVTLRQLLEAQAPPSIEA